MDHSAMGHAMEHGDMDMGGDRCAMSASSPFSSLSDPPFSLPPSLSTAAHLTLTSPQMLFTWDTTNLCIISRRWHIRGTPSLLFSLLAIVLLVAGYEALRSATQRYERSTVTRQEVLTSE